MHRGQAESMCSSLPAWHDMRAASSSVSVLTVSRCVTISSKRNRSLVESYILIQGLRIPAMTIGTGMSMILAYISAAPLPPSELLIGVFGCSVAMLSLGCGASGRKKNS